MFHVGFMWDLCGFCEYFVWVSCVIFECHVWVLWVLWVLVSGMCGKKLSGYRLGEYRRGGQK